MKRTRHNPEQIIKKLREAERLKDSENENKRLKKVVADLTLDKDILEEALKGNY